MIIIKGLNASINGYKILDNINISFPHFGIVSLLGDSGCGKTTFLNCIAGLLPYDGEVVFDGKNLHRYSEAEMQNFRLRNIGFIFQDFKLFDFETVESNIVFPLNVLNNSSIENKKRKSNDLLKLVGLYEFRNKKVKELSGGQKQRVAIGRALANDPKIILADEPTGALDSENASAILDIIQEISKNALVILVTHDEEIAYKYSDQIISFEDGKIVKIAYNQKRESSSYVPLCKNSFSNKKPNIPISFISNHIRNSLKEHKWRTRICNLILSISLLGTGLSISLSSTIEKGVLDSYSSIIDDSRIIVSNQTNDQAKEIISVSDDLVNEIKDEYRNYIDGVGRLYYASFDEFFPDQNKLTILGNPRNIDLNDYTAQLINDFLWLEDNELEIYPEKPTNLSNDEIILSLNGNSIENICSTLKIERSVNSLSNYIKTHALKCYFSFENKNWNYLDELLFTIKGFVVDFDPYVVHSNHLWNEEILEKQMRLPVNTNFSQKEYYPWVLKKAPYLHSKSDIFECIKFLKSNEGISDYIFEIADKKYYPLLYRNKDKDYLNRILVFNGFQDSIPIYLDDVVMNISDSTRDPIYSSLGGYSIFPENMMAGFAHQTYFTSDLESVDSIIDLYSSIDLNTADFVTLPDDILLGHYSKTLQNNVIFSVFAGDLIFGQEPINYEEIVVSSSLAKDLYGTANCVGKSIFVSSAIREILIGDNTIKREFETVELTISGVVESDRKSIYHESFWTIGFFQFCLGISAFDLCVNAISYNTGSSDNAESVFPILQERLPMYKITNPQSLIKQGIDEVVGYIEIILLVFSIVSVFISIILLYLCNSLHMKESRKDIGLSRCLGIEQKECIKFSIFYSFLVSFVSFVFSTFELLAINAITTYELSGIFSIRIFSINPLAILLMFVVSMIISFLSSGILNHKTKKLNALELLK